MNESALGRRAPELGRYVSLVVVALTVCAGCNSVSRTYASDSQGGSGGDGGSASGGFAGNSSPSSVGSAGTNSGGQPGSTGAGGTANANCAAGALLAPDLHAACVEDLGAGTLRITYDFANTEQGLDWAPSTGATVSVNKAALVVVTASNDVGVAIFKKKLHVNRASFRVSLLSGNTTLWYINTIWSGSWNPDAGYAGYHDNTGRGFIMNGTEYSPADVSPLSVGILHDFTIVQSDTLLSWDDGGNTVTTAVGPLPVTDRIFALGAWQSSAAFYNVVFEGTLN